MHIPFPRFLKCAISGTSPVTPPTVKQFLDRQDRLVKQIRTDGDNEYITTYTYDALGNVLECKDETAYSDYDVDYSQKYEYNYISKPVKVYNAEGNYIENEYDVLGNLLTQTDYMGNSTNYTYDSIGRLLTESAPIDTDTSSLVKYYYDANSNTICTTKAAAFGNVSYTNTYDNRNRLISSFDGAAYTVNEYDGNYLVKTASGLEEVTDISSLLPYDATYTVSTFTYDKFGNLASDTSFNGTTSYTYDVAGNVITSMNPNTDTTFNEYDSRGNLISSTIEGDTISYSYNTFNLVTEATRNGVSTTYAYDNFGRNTSEVTGSNSILRTYNTAGQVKAMTLKEGDTVLQSSEYEYNVLGNMTSASDGIDTVMYEYNENGFPVREEKPGLVTTYAYTPGNLMKNVTNTRRRVNDPTYEEGYNDLRFVSSFEYSYYPDGNVKNVTDTRFDKIYDTLYGYDAANRLSSAYITQNGNRVRSWSYSYNNRGDRISQTEMDETSTGVTTNYVYTNHRLSAVYTPGKPTTTYTYNANGNTLTQTCGDDVTTYTYTPRSEVASATNQSGTYTYTYNASSLRTSQTSNGVTTSFIWAGDNIIREDSPDKSTDYFYGVNRVSRTVKGDAYTYDAVTDGYYDEALGDYVETVVPVNGYHEFYAYDGRGNVVHTMALDSIDLYLGPFYGQTAPFPEMDLNCDGEFDFTDLNYANMTYPIVQDYYYSPFGELWQGERANDTNPFRYCGEYHDKETGNIYLRARYYDPSIGRFISEDPLKDGTNWYVYCGNNPIAFVDPSGLASYIFYLSEWEDHAQQGKQELMNMGIDSNDIILIPLNSEEDFENGWNNMGTILDSDGNEISVDIDHIIIDTHADPEKFGANKGWNLRLTEIDKLEDKDVKGNVVLLGCNAGHLDYQTNNVASHFAKKVNSALVIASDGTVVAKPNSKSGKGADGIRIKTPNGYYRSQNDSWFKKLLKNGVRENAGWVVYRYSGNTISTRVTGSQSKLLTISGACQLNY